MLLKEKDWETLYRFRDILDKKLRIYKNENFDFNVALTSELMKLAEKSEYETLLKN